MKMKHTILIRRMVADTVAVTIETEELANAFVKAKEVAPDIPDEQWQPDMCKFWVELLENKS
jgi:hypothetical protein